MNIHKPCGHCGSPLDWVYGARRQEYVVRCRTCLCRFDVHGLMTYGSATCLRLREKKQRGSRLTATRWARSLRGD